MTMKTRIAAIAVAVITMVGLFAVPASAAYENCPSNAFCTYVNIGGGGQLYYYTNVSGCINIGGGLNDTMSSARNRLGSNVKVYRDANCYPHFTGVPGDIGYKVNFPANSSVGDMGAYVMNDAASSFYVGNNAP